MKEHQFDIAFFMNPHPTRTNELKWHEAHKRCVQGCFHGDSSVPCNVTCPDPTDEHRQRKDCTKLWNVIHEEMPGKVYQVEEWRAEGTPLDFLHADRSHAIGSFDILADHWCAVD